MKAVPADFCTCIIFMNENNGKQCPGIPFAVDLDGTLIKTDLLWEAVILFLRAYPYEAFRLVFWVFSGKAVLKGRLACRITIPVSSLPYNDELLATLQAMKQQGRCLVLATGSHFRFAQPVADHLGCFDEVIATHDHINLTAGVKADALVSRFGGGGYDYIGNDTADIAVWEQSRAAYSVSPKGFILSNGVSTRPMAVLQRQAFAPLLRAIRPRQWIKNLLVFVPLCAAHMLTAASMVQSVWVFLGFCLCASSAYLVNDVLDAHDDRLHRIKKARPIAAGTLSIPHALVAALGLAGAAFLIGFNTSNAVLAVLICYYLLTTAYSIVLKRLLLLDVVTLSMLYILRVVGGAVATGIVLSFWLLAFLMFMLLSLALLKRHSELHHLASIGQANTNGRGYQASDAMPIAAMGIASGFLGMMVFMLYVNSTAVTALYASPMILMTIVPLLVYWHCRIWVLSFRSEIHEDPVFFISKDHVSAWVLLSAVLIASVATLSI